MQPLLRFYSFAVPLNLHSFPTLRLPICILRLCAASGHAAALTLGQLKASGDARALPAEAWVLDRKSTRLNSSHLGISYAVFCLKKKKKHRDVSTKLRHTARGTSTAHDIR